MSALSITARTKDAAETRGIAGAIASVSLPGDIILLDGDLGAGKTTFTRGFVGALGSGARVTSPTFNYIHTYAGDGLEVVHADLYRCDNVDGVIDIGLVELLDESNIAVIEWGERAVGLVGPTYCQIEMRQGENETERLVTLTLVGNRWLGREPRVRDALSSWAHGDVAHGDVNSGDAK